MLAKTATPLGALRGQLIALGIAKGLLFWYAIEKLFETRIGFSPEQIVLVGIIAQGSKVVFELPTSVFADRWSRRNILLLAQASMFVCCLVLGLSNSLGIYILGTLFWSLSDALTSGVYEAFAYDSLSTSGHKKHFQKVYTRMKSSELVAMALAGIVAGVLSLHFSLRLSYFLSLVSTLACGVLLRLPEPNIRRATDGASNWFNHIGGAIRILTSPQLRWPAAIYVTLIGFLSVWYEYYQLLGIDIKLSPLLFGSLISVLTFGMMIGSEIAHHKPGSRKVLTLVWVALLVTHLGGLRFHTTWIAFVSLFVTFIALMLLEIYLEIYIQDTISSERRATVFSLAATLGYACFFVLAALFGLALKPFGIRGALTLASLPILLLGAIDIARGLPWATDKVASGPLMGEIPER
jgi:MFS family permease